MVAPSQSDPVVHCIVIGMASDLILIGCVEVQKGPWAMLKDDGRRLGPGFRSLSDLPPSSEHTTHLDAHANFLCTLQRTAFVGPFTALTNAQSSKPPTSPGPECVPCIPQTH